MAYGVKYRLEFADIKGNKRKVEIFKNGYTGEVLPMIGTGEPVEIEWKAEEDLYEPLIGSLCTLNLLVTDDVTYDDFYLYDEREYKVVVYFEASAGSWQTYWSGWVVNDLYSQALVSTPYSLSITATDNLGQLDAFDTWMPAVGESDPTLWKFMWNALSNLQLDYDIYISNDLRIATDTAWKNIFDQVTIKKAAYYHDNYIINDSKMTLRSILLGFNCRIFQSFGRWYIINNSSYGDQRIIAGIQAGTYTGSGILTAKQGFLNGGTEEIKYWIYNASGVEQSTVTTNMLKVIPTNMLPIGQNLFRTPRRPVKKYQEIVDITQKPIDLNFNGSFEFGTEDWSANVGSIGSPETNPFAGRRAGFFIEKTNNFATFTAKMFSTTTNALVTIANQYQLLLSVLVENNGTSNKLPYYIKIDDLNGTNWYFNGSSNASQAWGTNLVWNTVTINSTYKYQSFKITTAAAPVSGRISVHLGILQTNDNIGHIGTNVDNVVIRNIDTEQNVYKQAWFIREQSGVFKTSDVLEHSDIYQANIPSGIFWGNFTDGNTFKRAQDANGTLLEQLITQQRLNDFRNYSMQYEGDLYNQDQYSIMSMAHKLWVKFNTLTETDSAIVDSIRVQLKSNIYTCQFHIPNNYTDVASSYRVSYQE